MNTRTGKEAISNVLVYCPDITNRVVYIFNFMLDTLLGLHVCFTSNKNEFETSNVLKINYSSERHCPADVHLTPNPLLFEKKIYNYTARIIYNNNKPELLLSKEGTEEKYFDLFAASFFLLARYEEYLDYTADIYGRFEAAASVMGRNNILHIPLINMWAAQLEETFSKAHTLVQSERTFEAKITIDVDQAYAFLHRGWKRNLLSFLKNTITFNTPFLKAQWHALIFQKDIFDGFSFLRSVQETYSLPFIYFINCGAYSEYDKNLPLRNKKMQYLLWDLKRFAAIGIHPSYYSNDKPHLLKKEFESLQNIIGECILRSRQHYLKLYFPHTYRMLIKAGITEDYTMGYATDAGFRAGTCTPFYWYDLEKETITGLKVFPITYMDGAFIEKKLAPEAAQNAIQNLLETVKTYKGCFIPLWHNNTVNKAPGWESWQTVFEANMQQIKEAKHG